MNRRGPAFRTLDKAHAGMAPQFSCVLSARLSVSHVHHDIESEGGLVLVDDSDAFVALWLLRPYGPTFVY